MKRTSSVLLAAVAAIAFSNAQAHDDRNDNKDGGTCPDTSFNGGGVETAFDVEFGTGAKDMTRCVENRKRIKVVMQVNTDCGKKNAAGACVAPYGFRNIPSMISDYTKTHGISADQVDIRVVAHGSGGKLLLKGNQFEANVKAAMDMGAKVYFCQNTVRSFFTTVKPDGDTLMHYGHASEEVIEGVNFVTGGLTALVDFQREGYQYIQP